MTPLRFAALAIALGTVACSTILGVFRGASMEVTVSSLTGTHWKAQSLALSNGLDDPNGLAGLEVEVGGRGVDRRVLTADDLPSAPFGVPESGAIEIDVRLRRDGRVVAAGLAIWDLEANVEWRIHVMRAPYAAGAVAVNSTGPNPIKCSWWWCHSVWRVEIEPEARNYEDEALWLWISRTHPDECQDVCF